METNFNTHVAFNNPMGMVTQHKVILYHGKNANVIPLHDITKVNLVKKREFNTNLLFSLAALFISTSLFYNIEMAIALKVLIASSAVGIFVWSVIGKFYNYNLIINLKDNKSYVLNANHFHREQLKSFYFSVRSILKKSKEDN